MKKTIAPLLFILAVSSLSLAGEPAEEEFLPIPSRIIKAAEGDWAEFKLGDASFRHRVEKIENGEGGRIVHFAIETLDGGGKVAKKEMKAITQAQERDASRRYSDAFDKRGAIAYGDTVLISDKPVAAIIYIDPGTGSEFWFSDAVGVLNLVRIDPGEGDKTPRRITVDFGTAADAPPAEEAK